MRNWCIVVVLGLWSVIWLSAGGFSVEFGGLALVGGAALACAGLSVFYQRWRPDARLAAMLTAVAQMLVLSAVAGVLSYVAASSGGPLWDATFSVWDKALGLEWPVYAGSVEAHPAIAWVGGLAYDSLQLQLLTVPLALGFAGRTRALGDFIAAFAFAEAATILLSGLMPALGAFPGQGVPSGDFPHLAPRDVYESAAAVLDLRQGALRHFAIADIHGIVCFPSFHAACGVLAAVSLWPVRALRWPILALDGLMIAATPLCGGHYFVDVMAGIVTALVALAAARASHRRAGRTPPVALVPATSSLHA